MVSFTQIWHRVIYFGTGSVYLVPTANHYSAAKEKVLSTSEDLQMCTYCWLLAIVPLFYFIPTTTYTSLCCRCYKIFAAVLFCCIVYYFDHVFLISIVDRLVIDSASLSFCTMGAAFSVQCIVF